MKNFFNCFIPISIFVLFFGWVIWLGIHKHNKGAATLGKTVVVGKDTLVVISFEMDNTCTLSNGKNMDYELFESVKLKTK